MKTMFLPVIAAILFFGTVNVCFAAPPNNCRFTTATAALNFGNLDPANPVDVIMPTTLIFRCSGTEPIAYSITDDDGLYESGVDANRMRNTTVITQFLPYSFTYSPASGSVLRNTNTTLNITGTVKGVDYINAYVGSYSDTITLTINP